MKVFTYYDETAHRAANACGRDYTSVYLPLMFKNMGVTSCPLSPSELLDGTPGEGDILFVGSDRMDAERSDALKRAAEKGCLVVGFGTDVTNELFGCPAQGLPAVDDPYQIVGYFTFQGQNEPLPVLGAFARLSPSGVDTAGVITADGEEIPGCLRTRTTCYFAFDLPATLWRCADGRPSTTAIPPFPFGRVPDGCVLPDDYNYEIAYADCYQRFLEGLIREAGMPSIFPLPPQGDQAADLVLYFGGDDDAGSAEIDMIASERMYERGLPYHMNLMPTEDGKGFVITREEAELICSRGQEISIHYNFLSYPYTPEGWKTQHDLYLAAFGQPAISPVNHCLVQTGSSAERCRLAKEQGALGDNNKFQNQCDHNDINAFNLIGYAFGSAFPRFTIDDAAHGNQEIGFCEVYGSYYEPRVYKKTDEEYAKIYRYLDEGVFYGRTLQLFFHPHYISDVITPAEPALEALDAAIAYVKQKGWQVVYCGPDALTYWWHDRAACRIQKVTPQGFELDNPTGRPLTLRLPDGVRNITVDGVPATAERKSIAGESALLLTLTARKASVAYTR